jgi:phage gp29-like protein
MPSIKGKQPRGLGKAAADELLGMLENMIQDAVAVIPEDSSVELKESASKGASSDVYLGLCNFMNSEISKAVLTATLTTEIQGKGSFAASETHAGAVARLSQGDRKLAVKALNTLIKWIYDFNFPSSSTRAEFMIFDEEDVNKDVADRDKVLTEAGVKFTKAYFKKTYSLEDEDFEVETSSTKTNPDKKPVTSGNQGPAEFAEKDKPPKAPEKKGVKALEEVISENKLQKDAEIILKPVFNLLSSSKSLDEVVPLIADLFPDLDTNEIEETLQRLIFISEVFGRLEEDGR